jgi:hypothetical protein
MIRRNYAKTFEGFKVGRIVVEITATTFHEIIIARISNKMILVFNCGIL